MKDFNQDDELKRIGEGGVISNLIGWLGANKTTVYLIIFLSTITGYSIFNSLPKEQFPEIVVPQIYVNTVYAGTAPGDIENLINKPLENQIKSEKGVKAIRSNALQDFSIILVEFNTNVPVQEAVDRVKSAIDKARNDLPSDLTQDPTAVEVNFSEFPIMNINLAGNISLEQLKNKAEDIQDAIEGLPEITRVDIVGGLDREIQINLDLNKMKAYGITFQDIQSAVAYENVNISGGDLSIGNTRRTMRVKGEFKSIEEIKHLIIRTNQGATVHLAEVADVFDGYEEKQDFARLNNKNVITLNIIKRGGENLIIASEKIEKILEEFKHEKLPNGIDVKITADSSERTKEDLNDLINTVVLGFIFVVLVLMFFMGVRDAIFVGLSVPLSALLALYPLLLMGFTLNTIVLFAFLLGLGLVVDDAIVVIENSHRIFNKYKDISITKAVQTAASEVFLPVLSGTLTTIAPFLPLIFWPGIVGEFMKFLPYTLIFTLVASLIVSYVMNPVFAISFMKREAEERAGEQSIRKPLITLGGIILFLYLLYFIFDQKGFFGFANLLVLIGLLMVLNHYILTPRIIIPFQEKALPAFKNFYKRIIRWTLIKYNSVWVTLSMVVLLVITFVLMGIVKPNVIFFPSGDPDYVYIYNLMPVGTDAIKTDSVTRIIEQRVFEVIKKNNAESAINSVISNVGKNAGDPSNPDRAPTPHKSKVTVAFVSKQERGNINSQEMLSKFREVVKDIPGSEISVERESNGPPTGKAITIEVVGEDFEILQEIQEKVITTVNASGIQGIDQLKSDLVTNKPELVINIDREKASREGVSSAQIASALRSALFGLEVSKFRDNKDEYPIQVRLKPEDRKSVEKLLSMEISYRDMNMGGALRNIPIASFAKVQYSNTFSQINRKDNERLVTISSDVIPEYANEVTDINSEIFEKIKDIEVPDGYEIRAGGSQEEQQEASTFLTNAFLIALAMIYLILAAQFNSLVKPLMIFVTIVLSLIGVLLGFMFFGRTFSVIMSGVGIIALAGIVVKNGILIIEFIDELRSRGLGLKEAIIEGGATRLTPVILTASAAVLGLIPLAFGLAFDFGALFGDLSWKVTVGGDSSVFWNILAWTIIYGLIFSTILTLVVVPCMYYINEKLKQKVYKKAID